MNCPVCDKGTLHSLESKEPPQRLVCGKCGGQWIKSYQYWKWLKAYGENLPEKPPEEGLDLPVTDSKKAKLCPECGHFLTRNKVGHGIDFHIDRCQTCGGIWFDKNEWEILKSRNLHDDVHFIFSAAWQNRIRQEEQQELYEERVETLLGPQDYERVRAFKSWAAEHSKRNTIMAYLANMEV
jgi:Zn-finger nucleic acid-binding protein